MYSVTLKDFKTSIFERSENPVLKKDNNGTWLDITSSGKKYSPQNNMEFRNVLQLFVQKCCFNFAVSIKTLSILFSDWSFSKMCQLYYGTNGMSLTEFPFFDCVSMELH